MSKKLSKYIAAFDYIDKALIVLSAISGGKSIVSFISVIRIPARIIVSASITLVFSLITKIRKKVLKITKKEKGKTQQIK